MYFHVEGATLTVYDGRRLHAGLHEFVFPVTGKQSPERFQLPLKNIPIGGVSVEAKDTHLDDEDNDVALTRFDV